MIALTTTHLSKKIFLTSLKTILSDKILNGPNIKKFEKKFSNHFRMKHAIAVSSARFAFYLILKNLNLKKDDEIIIPAYMPWIMVKVIIISGLKPVFVDIDKNTFNIIPSEIEKKITNKTKAVLAVHLYGLPCEIEKIKGICKKNNLVLIEDCAQAIGSKYKNKRVGTFGDFSFFSFGPKKIFNTYEGGMILTNNSKIEKQIRNEINKLRFPKKIELIKKCFKNHIDCFFINNFFTKYLIYLYYKTLITLGYSNTEDITSAEFKKVQYPYLIDRMTQQSFLKKYAVKYTNLQALVGMLQFENIDNNIKKINLNAKLLNYKIKNSQYISEKYLSSYFLYCVKSNNKEQIIEKLFKSRIIISSGHYLVLPDLDAFKEYKCECPNTREISKSIFYLPVQSNLKKHEMTYLLKILEKNCKEILHKDIKRSKDLIIK